MRFNWKSSKLIFIVASLFILSLVVAGCGGGGDDSKSSSEPVKWTANSVWPPENHQSIALNDFAEKVESATDGKVVLNVKTGGALGYEGPELLKAVRDGLVPVSDMLISGVAGEEKIFGVVTLPFLVQDFEEGKKLNEIARPYFDQVAEEKWNQKILYISPWPAAGLWTQDKVDAVEDMEGLQTRTYDQNGARVVEATGGTSHALPFSEVYSSLNTGMIDSVITSTPTAVDAKFWEVLDYYAPISITMATDMVTVNLDEFNKLDQETQEALVQAGKEMEDTMWDKVAQLDKDKEALCNENGIKTVEPSDEFMSDLTEVTKDIRQDWLKDAPPEAKEIVEKFKEEVGR